MAWNRVTKTEYRVRKSQNRVTKTRISPHFHGIASEKTGDFEAWTMRFRGGFAYRTNSPGLVKRGSIEHPPAFP